MLVRDKKFYGNFFSLLVVIALQNMIVFSVNLADNVMLGSYSELSLSGVSVANQIQFFLQMVVGGTANGMCVIASQYWGKREIQPIRRIFAIAMYLAIFLSAALTAFVRLAPNMAMGLFTDKQDVITEGVKYLNVICWSYVIFAVTNILLAVFRSAESAKIGFYVSIVTLVVNISLNYVLIFGRFGLPELGSAGAAIATLISRIVELVIVLFYTFFVDKKLHLRFSNSLKAEFSYFRDYMKAGLPLVLSSASWGIAMSVQTAILGHLDGPVIAANSIAMTIFQIIVVFANGTATAASIIIGKTVGSGNIPLVKSYAKTMQILFLGIGVLSSLSLYFVRDLIVSLYSVTPETAELGRDFITVLCVTIFGTSYQMPSLTGIVSGGGDTKFVLFNDIIFMWCIILPLSFISAYVLQLPPIYTFACLKADQILKCSVAIVKVNRFRWIRVLTRNDALAEK